jgi:hypothetical protein
MLNDPINHNEILNGDWWWQWCIGAYGPVCPSD